MNFATLDFNNLVLLGIAVIGLINTWMTARANATAKAANAVAVETRDIAKQNEGNTKALAVEAKQEREKMAALFDDALGSMKKARRK